MEIFCEIQWNLRKIMAFDCTISEKFMVVKIFTSEDEHFGIETCNNIKTHCRQIIGENFETRALLFAIGLLFNFIRFMRLGIKIT